MNDLAFLKQEDVKTFIRDQVKADVHQLSLKRSKKFAAQFPLIVNQILSRQKATGKLDQWATNFDLILPPPLSIEQASSELTGNYKSRLIGGDTLVDLTGGMGIDCLYLSNGFSDATYVEKQSELCEVFTHNCWVLDKKIHVVNQSAEDFIHTYSGTSETTYYLDPARRDQFKNRVFKIEDCTPNLVKLLPDLKTKGARVLVKLSPLLDLSLVISSVPHIREIHIVSVKNDCKEVLLLLDFSFQGNPEITCVNLKSNQRSYRFDWDTRAAPKTYSDGPGDFIYEPNSSILKAGAFHEMARDFPLQKIAPNTHLYTSNHILRNFPGRIFKLKTVADKGIIKGYQGQKINVITRNNPENAPALKKRWKLSDGGNEFLLAFRDQKNKNIMIIAERQHLEE